MIDGASYWQRVGGITLPLTLRTLLLVTLVSVIGSLLAFDQFYIMTNGQPLNQHGDIRVLRLPELVPLPEARLRRGAVADPGGDHPCVQRRSDDPEPPEPRMSAGIRRDGELASGRARARSAGSGTRGAKYLVGAMLIFICARHAAAVLRGVLPFDQDRPRRARALPPNFLPHSFSLRNYAKLWDYQAGLPVYLWNSAGTALLTIAMTLGLTVPAGYGLARFPIPARRSCSSSCCFR